jgi:hypothetical protein
MKNWTEIVEAHHLWAHPGNDFPLVARPPASTTDLQSFKNLFGPAASAELSGFYEQMDGFGIEETPGVPSWFISPIEKLPELIKQSRKWMKETHPDLAERFFPFVDWNCGDYSGYLLSGDGTLLDGIFTFEHEEYKSEKGQDVPEFMYSLNGSLEEFLSEG